MDKKRECEKNVVRVCLQHGHSLPCNKCDEPQPDQSSRLLTDEEIDRAVEPYLSSYRDPSGNPMSGAAIIEGVKQQRREVAKAQRIIDEDEIMDAYLRGFDNGERQGSLKVSDARIEALKNRMRAIAALFPTKSVDQIISLIEINDRATHTSKGEEHND